MSTATHTVGVNDTRPDVAPGEFGLRLQKSDGTSAHAADVKEQKSKQMPDIKETFD